MFQRILDNLNRPNPLSMDELEFPIEIESCPKDDDPNWFHSPIGEIDNLSQELPFAIPEIQEDEVGNCMIRLGIVVTLLSRQFRNKDNNCRNKMMETIKILEIILPEKHN